MYAIYMFLRRWWWQIIAARAYIWIYVDLQIREFVVPAYLLVCIWYGAVLSLHLDRINHILHTHTRILYATPCGIYVYTWYSSLNFIWGGAFYLRVFANDDFGKLWFIAARTVTAKWEPNRRPSCYIFAATISVYSINNTNHLFPLLCCH